jgi:mRNA interferase RelE/StbE
MQYFFTKNAVKNLRSLEIDIQERILEKLDFYITSNDPLGFARPLRDYRFGHYRFRIGEYRVIFDFRDSSIVILAIGNRRDVYR